MKKLKKNYPNAIYEYRPQFLHGKTSSQSIDIFIPELNLGIEYHGRQHFMPIKRFDGVSGFNITKERDLRKYNKCKENGITLLYASYEKEVPQDYFSKIYTDYDSLLNAISQVALQENKHIKITEGDIRNIVTNIINKLY